MSAFDLGPRYETLRELGQGGAGRVLLVRDHYLGKDLALKLLKDGALAAAEIERLKEEFSLLSRIDHPGIARVHDFGYRGGRPYFTSDYIAGAPLAQRGPIQDFHEILALADPIAAAVAFLHASGILHLDIKPSNIMVPAGDPPRRPVLIDFGLFRRPLEGRRGSGIEGSLPYLAPERFRGEAPGTWTDVYALGVTFYKMITGRFARDGASFDAVPRPLTRACPHLPRDLESIVLTCMALDPRARFRSAGELHAALRTLGGAARIEVKPSPALLPLLERKAELEQVERFLDGLSIASATPAAPAALLVTAPPGMGQTSLFREMKVRAQTRGLRFYLETGYPGQTLDPGALLRPLGSDGPRSQGKRGRWDSFLARLRQPHRSSRSETLEEERRLRWAAEVSLAAGLIRRPLIISVDGLQLWDEVSIELIFDLLRFLDDEKQGKRPPIGVALGYREEGPHAPLLRELSAFLLRPGAAVVVTLKPLGLEAVLELYRSRGGRTDAERAGLEVFQRTGGCPARIAALTPSGEVASEGGSLPLLDAAREHLRRMGPEALEVLLTLELLRKPAGAGVIARFSGVSPARARRVLAALGRADMVVEVDLEHDRRGFLPTPTASAVLLETSESARRGSHLRIAREVLRRRAPGDSPRAVEALHHFQAAGASTSVAKHGFPAARYLRSTFQNRAALNAFRAVLEALPSRCRSARLEAALEMADLHARIGDLDEGIRLLWEMLRRERSAPGVARKRILLRLATLHSRRGDYRRADALFRKGLHGARGGARAVGRREFLFFLNEHAALKAFLGEYREAIRLCGEGLRLAGRSRALSTLEVALNLHATKGSVTLRTFDLDSAIRDFETSLEIAESIGSPANQAVILNNLGIAYGQSDRYTDAIRAFSDAEKTCLRLDEGPSLASIYSNLAILHSKQGRFESADRALEEGERLGRAAIGRRQVFFLKHARGLSLVSRGRYAQARTHLDEAIRLGEALGDPHITTFDELYRAEALLFEGSYAEAASELSRLREPSRPLAIRQAALARQALLLSLTGRGDLVKSAALDHDALVADRVIPFPEAWNRLFLAWAFSISGLWEEAKERLDLAEKFFTLHQLAPGIAMVLCVKAEGLLLAGRAVEAREIVEREDLGGNDLASTIHALLLARLLLQLGKGSEDRARCADSLARAGALLVGNPLPEWSLRLCALRAALLPGEEGPAGTAESERRELALRLPPETREGFLGSRHWLLWTSGFRSSIVRRGRRGKRPPAREPGPSTERRSGSGSNTTLLGRKGCVPLRRKLVASSPAMKRLVSMLDRIRRSELPVLIRGEMGSGKELIARLIHEESRRSAGPFRVVDCATIPTGLLESEVFGARAGAFTDLTRDRKGILEEAAGGSVFIDEIGGAPLEAQAKFLRVISEKSFRPLGSEEELRVDARFLFSTSRDVEAEARQGRLRPDILHRLQVLTVHVPPLRERPEDLPGLVDLFLKEGDGEPPALGAGVLERLRELPWPGNIRELRNLIARLRVECPQVISREAVDRARGELETSTIFPRNVLSNVDLPALKDRLEREYLLHHFCRLDGDSDELCRFLDLSRQQLYRTCARLGIHLRGERRKKGLRETKRRSRPIRR